MKALKILGLATLVAILAGCAAQSATYDDRSIIVLIEKTGLDSLGSNSNAANRAADAISNQLNQSGFTVYDRSVVDERTRFNGRLNGDDLLDIARNNSGNIVIDLAAAVDVRAQRFNRPGSTEAKLTVSGRAVEVATGKLVGTYEQSSSIRTPSNCAEICLRDRVGDLAADLGAAAGDELARLILGATPSLSMRDSGEPEAVPAISSDRIYSMELDNIDDNEYLEVESMITEDIRGFIGMDLISSAGLNHRIEYRSHLNSNELLNAIRNTLAELDWESNIYLDQQSFLIKKSPVRDSTTTPIPPRDQNADSDRKSRQSDFYSW